MAVKRFKKIIDEIDKEIFTETGIRNAYEKYCGKFQMEDLFTTDTIYLSALTAAAGFRSKPDTKVYMDHVWIRSYEMKKMILNNHFKPKYKRKVLIRERGKEREIHPPVFESKVAQKCICSFLLRPFLEPKMIETNYASLTGKGVHKMYEDIERALNSALKRYPDGVVVLGDYSGYFASISIDREMEILQNAGITDNKVLDFIRMFSPDSRGLYLGNEASQIPASFFPSAFDHHRKDEMRDAFYFRYMDDSLNILKDMQSAEEYIQDYCFWTEKMDLSVKNDKIRIYQLKKTFRFCKETFRFNKKTQKYDRIMNPKRISMEAKKLCAIKDIDRMTEQYRSVRGAIASHPHTYRAIEKLDNLFISKGGKL